MHYVYILKCKDGSFYVGMTNNIKRRKKEHQDGLSKSTKHRLPISLSFCACFPNKHKAASFEKYLKSHSGRAFLNKRLI